MWYMCTRYEKPRKEQQLCNNPHTTDIRMGIKYRKESFNVKEARVKLTFQDKSEGEIYVKGHVFQYNSCYTSTHPTVGNAQINSPTVETLHSFINYGRLVNYKTNTLYLENPVKMEIIEVVDCFVDFEVAYLEKV